MTSVLQIRRGTTAQNNSFTGALAELSVDTSTNTLRVHDAVTAGGTPIMPALRVTNAQRLTVTPQAGQVVFVTDYASAGVSPTWIGDGSTVGGVVAAGAVVSSASTATNVAGGTAGQVLYQTGPGTSAFFGPGTVGQVLLSGGILGPAYSSTLTYANGTVTVSSSKVATSTNTGALVVAGGMGIGGDVYIGGKIVAQELDIQYTTVTTTLIQTDDVIQTSNTTPTYSTATGALKISGGIGIGGGGFFGGIVTATNFSGSLAGGTAGAIVYQSGAGATTFLGIGTNGYVLTSNGSIPTWTALSGLSAGLATTATNVAGGTAGQVPYQTAAGATGFYGPGSFGQFLISGGTGAPSYSSTLTMSGGSINITGTADATTTQTGALIVTGGVGIGGNLQVGGNITAQGNIVANGNITLGNQTTDTLNVGADIVSNLIPDVTNTYDLGSSSQAWNRLYVKDVTASGVITATTFVGNLTGVATTSTNLAGGTAGQLPYQTAAGATSFTGPGSYGQFLMSTGAGAPVYQSTLTQVNGNIIVGTGPDTPAFSTTTGLLQILNGGVGIGKSLWVGTTATIAGTLKVGGTVSNDLVLTAGQIYKVGGSVSIGGGNASAPNITGTAGFVAGNNSTADIYGGSGAVNLRPNANYQVVVYSNSSTFSTQTGGLQIVNGGMGVGGSIFVGGVVTATTFVGALTGLASNATNATNATNISGGAAGSLPYQSGAGATTFLGIGTNGYVLTSNGSAPVWSAASGITAGYAAQVQTTAQPLSATYYPAFVDANNASATAETVYTTSSFMINPGTKQVGIGYISTSSALTVNGRIESMTDPASEGGQLVLRGKNWYRWSIDNYQDTFRIIREDDVTEANGIIALSITTGSNAAVLVGATTPTTGEKLSVNGGGYFNGILTATTFVGALTGIASNATTATSAGTAYATIGTHTAGTGLSGTAFNGSANQTWTLNTATLMQVATQVVQSHSTGTGILGSAFNGSTAQTWSLDTSTLMNKTVNLAGGSAGQFAYQSAANTTAFMSTGSMYVNRAVTADATQAAVTFNNSNSGDSTGITFNGGTARTVSANTLGALSLAGGGTVSGAVTFSGPVTFSGTATYVSSTQTYYTDNIINLHVPPGGVDTAWTTDDGKDIGFRFHYFNGADTNAALVLANDSKFLEFYAAGAEGTSTFVGSYYGNFKTGNIVAGRGLRVGSLASSTATVVGEKLYVSGGIYATDYITATTFVGALSQSITAGTGLSGTAYNGSAAQTWTLNTATLMQVATQVVQSHSTGTGILGAAYNGSTAQTWSLDTSTLMNKTVNLASGSAGSLPYQSGANATTYLGIGTSGYVLTSNGTAPTWSALSGLSAGTATTATNLAGGTAGQIVYQTAAGSTSFAGPGTAGQLLMSAGTSAPTYTNTASIYVNSAVYAEELRGGAGGAVVYQSAANVTDYTSTATTGNFLQANFNGAPTWTTTGSMYVQNAVIATHQRGGTAGQLQYQSAVDTTAFINTATTGNFLQANYTGAPTWTTTASMYVQDAVVSTNLRAGAAGSIPYQSGANATTFLGIGTSGYVLTSNGSAPTWSALSGLTAGSATTATSAGTAYATIGTLTAGTGLSGTAFNGSANQTWTLATAYGDTTNPYGNKTANYVLAAPNGVTGAPTFRALVAADIPTLNQNTTGSAGSVANAHSAGTGLTGSSFNGSTAVTWTLDTSTLMNKVVNLASGAAGSLPYQTGANATGFLGIGSNGYVLTSNGSAPVWTAVSSLSGAGSVANAVTFNNGGSGDASGTTYNGSAARTISYNTLGAAASNQTMYIGTTAVAINRTSGALSLTGVSIDGSAGSATNASNLSTVMQTASANYYLTFVDSNNSSAAYEAYYTTSSFVVNPASGNVGIGTGGATLTNKFEVRGSAGQLFSVNDSFTGTIFSANDVSGIPSIEVLDTGLVKLAQYNGQVTINTGTAQTNMGLTVNSSTYLMSLGVGTVASGTTGEIRATNEITAYYSDRRLKENVKVIDNAVTKVLSLNGITYTPNEVAEQYGYSRTTKLVGLFADEVEAVLPEATRPAPFDVDENGGSKSGENYKTIQYEKLVPLLIEAVKEQQATIDTLKAELASIKSLIAKG